MHKISFRIGLNILNPNYFRTCNFNEVIWHVIRTLLINKNENRYSDTSTKKISNAIRIFEYYSNTYTNIRIPILGFVAILSFIWNTFSLSLVIFWKNGLQIFYQNFSTQMTLAKVTKWPWPLAFISDWLDFISIPKSTITTQKWKFLAFPIQMPMEPKLTLP